MIFAVLLAAAVSTSEQAERLAEQAVAKAGTQPAAALVQARKALDMTADFEPTAYVKAGKKGEVVEDEFLAARNEYRSHRAKLYEAVGLVLAAQGQNLAAARYLGRAILLEASPARTVALARARLSLGQGRIALEALHRQTGLGGLPPEVFGLVAEAADAAGLPSAQAEVDRARIMALSAGSAEWRDGPLTLPPDARLSSNPVVRLDEAPITVVYVAETSCRSCSGDLEAVKRMVPPDVRVLTVPEVADQDVALRQVLQLYRYDWPVLVGKGIASWLKAPARTALVVARRGWAGAVVKAPFGPSLASVLQIFAKDEVRETVPRAGWNQRPVDRRPSAAPPGMLPEGFAPGEDDPAPAEFTSALVAYREGRAEAARKLLDALAARGDGWLLPPEARFDKALCLAKAGQAETARRILLRIGDSRFQDEVDRALENVSSQSR
jgi:tetratricopeptide (TPR) repeat protein